MCDGIVQCENGDDEIDCGRFIMRTYLFDYDHLEPHSV